MAAEGRRFNLQSKGAGSPPNRHQYGLHFNNVPDGMRNDQLECLFNDFGSCNIMRDHGAPHGWVGFETMQKCIDAYEHLRGNGMGMHFRKGPYETRSPRPPMGAGFPPIAYGPHMPPPMAPRYLPADPYGSYGFYDDYYGYDEMMPYNRMPYDRMPYDRMPYERMPYPSPYGPTHPDMPGYQVGECLSCGVNTSYSCDRCGAFYCSERCQRLDWSVHQNSCDKNMPSLNFGNRHLPDHGDVRDLSERRQRLPITDGPIDGRGGDRLGARQIDRVPEDRSSDRFNRRTDGEQPGGRFQQGERRQGDCRSEEGRSEGGFNRRQNDCQRRADDGDGARRPDDTDRRPNDTRGDNASDRRRPDNASDRRTETGFPPRRNEDRRQNDDRPSDSSERRGDVIPGRRPNDERRNENGFSPRKNEDRNGFDRRPSDRDRRPFGDRRNDNGFGDRRGENDSRPGGNERRNFSGESRSGGPREGRPRFGDRKSGDCPEESSDCAKPVSPREEKPKDEASGYKPTGTFVKPAGGDLTQRSAEDNSVDSSQSEAKKLLPVVEGVRAALKNNDTVVITSATSTDCIHVSPQTSCAYGEGEVSKGIAEHCKTAPALVRAPAPNEVVACQFDLDNLFYRAVLKTTLPGEEYVMEFCDFGNMQKCKCDKLKALPDTLKKFPWNAVKVSLRGVDVVPVKGKLQNLFIGLSDNEVALKIQFEGDISNGVELIKPSGESVNKEVISLIGQGAEPEKKETSLPAKRVSFSDANACTAGPSTPNTEGAAPSTPNTERAAPSTPNTERAVPSTSNAEATPRSPEVVLSSLLSKLKLPQSQPQQTFPVEEGVCVLLENGDTVSITCSTDTGCTYITPVLTESKEFMLLTSKLNEHCASAPPLGREPRENEVVACKFTDSLYYRVVLEEVLPDGVYNMLFCDYGNKQKCKANELKAIPNALKVLPRCAVKVYFRDVDPVRAVGRIGSILEELTSGEVQLKLRFDGSIANGVELIRPDGRSVNDELRACIAESRAPSAAPAAPAATEGTSAAANQEPTENLRPVASIPLPTNRTFPLLVSQVVDCFLIAGCNASAPEVKRFETSFSSRLTQYCLSKPNEEYRPKVGDMCLAKYEGDWFRALTMEVSDEDDTRVIFFVDYGNTHTVGPTDLRKITQEFRTYPHVMTLCKVISVAETEEEWARIKSKFEGYQVFKGVTAIMTGDSTADVTITQLQD